MCRTTLLPMSIISLLYANCYQPNKCVVVYNTLLTGIFAVMAILIMRLKLLFVPQLCLVSGLVFAKTKSKPSKPIGYVQLILFGFIILTSSITGIEQIQNRLTMFGEYSNPTLEQMIQFVNTETNQDHVFAG